MQPGVAIRSWPMILWLRHFIGWMVGIFVSREDLILENLALRQQLLARHSKRPRHRLSTMHKLFWIALRRLWSEWKAPLILVTPRTVVAWHGAGFRLYWRWRSRARPVGGRKRVSTETRGLIFRMAAENPTWGAPHIHGELPSWVWFSGSRRSRDGCEKSGELQIRPNVG